jgi:hypothetical protein
VILPPLVFPALYYNISSIKIVILRFITLNNQREKRNKKLTWRHDTRHNDIQHNDTQDNGTQHNDAQHNNKK